MSITVNKEAIEHIISCAVENMHNIPFNNTCESAIMNMGEIQVQIVITSDEDRKFGGIDHDYTGPAIADCIKNTESHGPMPKLTKREYLAGLAMQGILSGLHTLGDAHGWSFKDVASESVRYSVALIKELEVDP